MIGMKKSGVVIMKNGRENDNHVIRIHDTVSEKMTTIRTRSVSVRVCRRIRTTFSPMASLAI
jgi:hypothetical protein